MTSTLEIAPDMSHYPSLSETAFQDISDLVYESCGVVLGKRKKSLIVSRLARRVRALGLPNFDSYIEHVRETGDQGRERQQLINCITTNKTDFFRERHHFELIAKRLPELTREKAARGQRRLRVWSSACSTGEEPYSVAMLLHDFFGPKVGWDIRVLASDIHTGALLKARQGVYPSETLAPIPERYRARYFTPESGGHAIANAIRRMVIFRRINLVTEKFVFRAPVDLVFCRNVLIYFDPPTKNLVIDRLASIMPSGGILFIGHSEGMAVHGKPFRPLGNTAYQKT